MDPGNVEIVVPEGACSKDPGTDVEMLPVAYKPATHC